MPWIQILLQTDGAQIQTCTLTALSRDLDLHEKLEMNCFGGTATRGVSTLQTQQDENWTLSSCCLLSVQSFSILQWESWSHVSYLRLGPRIYCTVLPAFPPLGHPHSSSPQPFHCHWLASNCGSILLDLLRPLTPTPGFWAPRHSI